MVVFVGVAAAEASGACARHGGSLQRRRTPDAATEAAT